MISMEFNRNGTKCCCCINLRTGIRIIAILFMINEFIGILFYLFQFTFKVEELLSDYALSTSSADDILDFDIEMYILGIISLHVILFYVNYRLLKATYKKNVEIIKLWLFVYALSIISQLVSGAILIKLLEKGQILYTISEFINISVYTYFEYVVFRFYQEEN